MLVRSERLAERGGGTRVFTRQSQVRVRGARNLARGG